MHNKKAILFDLDDTLYDYQTTHEKVIQKLFKKINKITGISIEMIDLIFQISQKEIKRQLVGTAASHNRDLYFQKFFELINTETKNKISPKNIIELFQFYRKTFFRNMKEDPNSTKILKYLKKKGIKIGIITDSQNYSQLKKLEILKISEFIDILVSSEEAGVEKPHSGPFLLAAHKLDVLAKECIMVGDNISRDIQGAQALGIKGIRINRHNKGDEGVHPSYKVSDTQELLNLIKKII